MAEKLKAYLVYHSRVFPITKEMVKLGRDLDNTLVLSSKSISRFHAEIFFDGKDFKIRDMNSTGGTLVNAVAVKDAFELKTKDEISLAGIKMVFYTGEEDQLDVETKLRTGALKRYNPKEKLSFD